MRWDFPQGSQPLSRALKPVAAPGFLFIGLIQQCVQHSTAEWLAAKAEDSRYTGEKDGLRNGAFLRNCYITKWMQTTLLCTITTDFHQD